MADRYLVEIFLPLSDAKGKRFPARLYETVREELVSEFGGMTAYVRSPAVGLWKPEVRARAERDLLIIYEVMAPQLKRKWWSSYRQQLQERFCQQKLVIRAQSIRSL